MNMNLCVMVGHNRKESGAYCKELDMTENKFGRLVAADLLESGIDVDVLTRRYVQGRGYSTEMNEELAMVNAGGYDLCIELHFNSASNPEARGCEVLAYDKSSKGREYGIKFCQELNKLTGIPIRRGNGIVPITSKNDRGGVGIMGSKCPYILIEPFFCSNAEDSKSINPLIVAEAIRNIIK